MSEWWKWLSAVARGQNNSQIAQAVGVSGVTVGNWSRGSRPAAEQVLTVARTYLEDENGQIIADTNDAQTWPAFYDLGWTKNELHAGRLDAWASEYDEWVRADRVEYLTEDAAYELGWETEAVAHYFNFSEWETLPDDPTWDRIIERITDLEPDEDGNLNDTEIQAIISEEMDELSGQDLKDTRLALGLSQDALANMLGVKQPTIARWEQSERAVPRGLRSELAGIIARFEADLEAGDTSGPWGPVVRFWAGRR